MWCERREDREENGNIRVQWCATMVRSYFRTGLDCARGDRDNPCLEVIFSTRTTSYVYTLDASTTLVHPLLMGRDRMGSDMEDGSHIPPRLMPASFTKYEVIMFTF